MLAVFIRQKWGGRAFSEEGTARAKALGPKKRQSKFRKCGANMGSRGGAGDQTSKKLCEYNGFGKALVSGSHIQHQRVYYF